MPDRFMQEIVTDNQGEDYGTEITRNGANLLPTENPRANLQIQRR
jgi:hypothetical protein